MGNLTELETKVRDWAQERGIYEHSTASAQLLKAVSELGELADAEIKGQRPEQMDAVGDVVVCLINYAAMHSFSVEQALAEAWLEIKDRKGQMVPGGAFVKEE